MDSVYEFIKITIWLHTNMAACLVDESPDGTLAILLAVHEAILPCRSDVGFMSLVDLLSIIFFDS